MMEHPVVRKYTTNIVATITGSVNNGPPRLVSWSREQASWALHG